MSGRVKVSSPGEEVAVSLGFEYEIESVEGVFVQERVSEEMCCLGTRK